MLSKLILAAVLSPKEVAGCRGGDLWSGLRCYAQQPTKNDSESLYEPDHQGSLRRSISKKKSGSVVHYQPGSGSGVHGGSVPRSEVVASVNSALAGGNNFEVQFTRISSGPQGPKKVLMVEDLTRDGMQLDGNLSQNFQIYNAFVVAEPDVLYTVKCLKKFEDCDVSRSDLSGHALVDCVGDESSISSDDIPVTCLAKYYDLALKTFKDGPHFFLHATSHDSDAGQDGCPSNVAFYSQDGIKKKASLFENDFKDIPGHKLGSASLGEILRAEEHVEPYFAREEPVGKNCATYSRDILRGLGIPETKELAQYVIYHLGKNPAMIKRLYVALGKGKIGAFLALNFGSHEKLFQKVVYDQLEIKDEV